MQEFFSNIVSGVGLNDVVDIGITAFIIYKVLGFIKKSRAQQLLAGLLIVVAIYFLADFLELHTLNWMMRSTLTIAIFAVVVIFQPELRRALEVIGRSTFFRNSKSLDRDNAERIVREIAEEADWFSETKTGCLIVFEGHTSLEDIVETGTILNAEISSELLGNLFYEGSPLHDGAVIVRDGKVLAAGCVLPLTENKDLSKSLGTRHRAGIGVTETSDALSLIVSEETGIISIAEDGNIRRFLDRKAVEKALLGMFLNEGDDSPKSIFERIVSILGGNRNAE